MGAWLTQKASRVALAVTTASAVGTGETGELLVRRWWAGALGVAGWWVKATAAAAERLVEKPAASEAVPKETMDWWAAGTTAEDERAAAVTADEAAMKGVVHSAPVAARRDCLRGSAVEFPEAETAARAVVAKLEAVALVGRSVAEAERTPSE